MATNAKLNTYAEGDSDLTNIMMVLDRTRIGFMQVSLTEMDTTTIPEVAAGSLLEVAGALYSITADEAISTTDPVTETTVADGTVYIMAIPDGNDITFALTATAPLWSDSKQGWYGTGAYASYRYVGGCWIKKSSNYYGKFFYISRQLYRPEFIYDSEELTTEIVSNTGTHVFSSFPVRREDVLNIAITYEMKVTSNNGRFNCSYGDNYYYIDYNYENVTSLSYVEKTGYLKLIAVEDSDFILTLTVVNDYSGTTYARNSSYRLTFPARVE